jgi:GTP-binding protein HflX
LRDDLELAPNLRVPRVFVSAVSGEGLDLLRQLIASYAAPPEDLKNAGVATILPDGSPIPDRH